MHQSNKILKINFLYVKFLYRKDKLFRNCVGEPDF